MAKKYNKCTKCEIDTPLNYSKYCDECRLQISLTNLKKAGYKPKDRSCRKCNETFFATGPSSVHCPICAPEIHKEKSKISHDKSRRRKGVNVGIGSGNSLKGIEHPSYVNGTGMYRNIARNAKGDTCERCNITLDFSTKKWCVHHKDHNRLNNALDNLELLCRSCHALEHRIGHLPNR